MRAGGSYPLRTIEAVEDDKSDRPVGFNRRVVLFGAFGILALGALGTWLVWYSTYLDHTMRVDEIRGACARTMPETVERCVDTVILQRGGARR